MTSPSYHLFFAGEITIFAGEITLKSFPKRAPDESWQLISAPSPAPLPHRLPAASRAACCSMEAPEERGNLRKWQLDMGVLCWMIPSGN